MCGSPFQGETDKPSFMGAYYGKCLLMVMSFPAQTRLMAITYTRYKPYRTYCDILGCIHVEYQQVAPPICVDGADGITQDSEIIKSK